ncbi:MULTISPECIES: hypothetical protein [Rhodopseudomonas]|jgi:hypothetical protein|uniref:hypothetical protein n=1 Tax=Rhodopseudomonas TaxID=1073 RepID=UPI000DF48705|nr:MULTISPECIES: hypothetical protein [Rhodopseudomonas]
MSDDSAPATKPTSNSPVAGSDGALAIVLDDATLTAVDQWATRLQLPRSVALARLVQLGLGIASGPRPPLMVAPDRAVELAASQIHALIDQDAPLEERDRRIARLVEGPPEFVEARVDLPRRRATDRLPPGDPALSPPAPGTPQRRATDRSARPD